MGNTQTENSIYISIFVIIFTFLSQTNSSALNDVNTELDKVHKCQVILDDFAAWSANFTSCAIKHARPIKLCEACIQQYLNVSTAHNNILEMEDESGEACKKKLLNLDRLEVIEQVYQYVQNLWQRGHCNYCFVTKNGTLTSELSAGTLGFQKISSETKLCIKQHSNMTAAPKESQACGACSDQYFRLNEFYEKLKGVDGSQDICIDIVDVMNSTRTFWSKDLGCCQKKMTPEVPLLIFAIIIAITPVVFYWLSRRFSDRSESRVVQQNRYVEQFNFPSTSGASS